MVGCRVLSEKKIIRRSRNSSHWSVGQERERRKWAGKEKCHRAKPIRLIARALSPHRYRVAVFFFFRPPPTPASPSLSPAICQDPVASDLQSIAEKEEE